MRACGLTKNQITSPLGMESVQENHAVQGQVQEHPEVQGQAEAEVMAGLTSVFRVRCSLAWTSRICCGKEAMTRKAIPKSATCLQDEHRALELRDQLNPR